MNQINILVGDLILLRAIEKYGKQNFENKLICKCFSREELNQKEIEYISRHKYEYIHKWYDR